MKFRHLVALLPAILLVACSSNDEKDLDPNVPLYQEYQVFLNQGQHSAFANFRKGGAAGECVKLNNGASISVNGGAMEYYRAADFDMLEYDYTKVLNVNDKEVTFKFTRAAGKVFTNSVNLTDLKPVEVPVPDKIVNGELYDFEAPATDQDIKIWLVQAGSNVPYVATIQRVEGKYSFDRVPAGAYGMYVDTEIDYPTLENDGNAGGIIRLISRTKLASQLTVE